MSSDMPKKWTAGKVKTLLTSLPEPPSEADPSRKKRRAEILSEGEKNSGKCFKY